MSLAALKAKYDPGNWSGSRKKTFATWAPGRTRHGVSAKGRNEAAEVLRNITGSANMRIDAVMTRDRNPDEAARDDNQATEKRG